ncbi:MAG: hypothetical protein ACD_71C00179G0001 [uncultured bacterium (gcode 4)]|uniref:HTH cro/C1-type domain-containing protein n=1 Tax=uncultured bacterium (gcode 4) TaxID=1234023 RepID=K1Z4V0_9BACT|nr:MAG: hypothetical protein ACD_71C00179G0001 [uncultured bacterium (gcode 4)]
MALTKQEKVTLWLRLKNIRKNGRHGKMTQEQLAEKVWIPVITYMKMEQGHTKNPSFLTIWKICETLGYSLDEFVKGVEKKENNK